jgi:hypothetical protein
MNLFEQYALLDVQIKDLTKQKDEAKKQIISEMIERGQDKEATSVGKFTIVPLKTWTYSEKVYALEDAYKAQKAREESTQEATYEIKPSMRFTPNKL